MLWFSNSFGTAEYVLPIFLPPYSPDLNPIEQFFSSVKATFKRFIGQDPSPRRNPYILPSEQN